jgi:succinylglutamate desuccinylase
MNRSASHGLLHEMEGLPEGILGATARDLGQCLAGPTLFHLPGRRPEPLFASVLLHGNEETGLLAIQGLIRRYRDRPLPRALSVYVGNITAARYGLRRLDHQPDYNRIWPEGEAPDSTEAQMMRRIVDIMAQRGVFASVDIHNNSGLNPHYACLNRLDHRYLQLATLFSRTVVYFLRPRGVQSMAFARLCPAVTLECGKPGGVRGIQHAVDYLDACLHLSDIPSHAVADHDIDLFHTMAQVKVREGISFGFHEAPVDIVFGDDLDRFNFRELPAETELGRVRDGHTLPLIAIDEAGAEVSERYFGIRDGRLLLTRAAMPSMLTLDERVVRQDCLCYLMERLSLERVP